MKIHHYGPLVVLFSFPLTASLSQVAAAPAPGRGASVEEATLKAVSAAKAFQAALDDRLRAKVSLPLNPKTRSNWSNLPTGSTFQSGATERNGVKLGDLTPAQQEEANKLSPAQRLTYVRELQAQQQSTAEAQRR